MKSSLKFIGAVAALTLVSAGAANAATLYSQAYDGLGNLFASQNAPGGFGGFATVYDNFTLSSSAIINNVAFTGGYFNPATPSAISNFTVSIYGDSAGQPGGLLYSEVVPGSANETPLACSEACATYSVGANFAAAAGAQYWLSVVPTIGFPPQWGWAAGTGGDGVGYQDFFGARNQVGADFAFTLSGGAGVPEPTIWAMMLVGFGGLGMALRSRRKLGAATA